MNYIGKRGGGGWWVEKKLQRKQQLFNQIHVSQVLNIEQILFWNGKKNKQKPPVGKQLIGALPTGPARLPQHMSYYCILCMDQFTSMLLPPSFHYFNIIFHMPSLTSTTCVCPYYLCLYPQFEASFCSESHFTWDAHLFHFYIR